MIFDQLKNTELYFQINNRFRKAFDYLKSNDFNNIEPGKYEIDGEDIYAIVQQYDTKPMSSGKWEAHKKYIDIQFMVSGKEKMGYSHKNKMIVTHEYNSDKDALYLKGEGNFLVAEAGYFAIFFPTDVHMPCIAINLSTPVKKVVIKVMSDSYKSELSEDGIKRNSQNNNCSESVNFEESNKLVDNNSIEVKNVNN
ncbi:MAG: YhcH/YjgK/YiaL family protein [Melioribacter sp.]|nr:YhcH/YjgK/YiaL family protein [Melioribacter sp.]